MSFSSDVKAELCRSRIQHICCAKAEAFGALLYCSQFSSESVKIITESTDFSKRLPSLFRKAFQIEFDEINQTNTASAKQIFLITNKDKLNRIWNAFGSSIEDSIAHHINFALLEEKHCQLSFLRGAFLAGGSVTNPQKGYHLELVTSHYNVSRELTALLLDLDYRPKDTTRKSNYVTYFKQSDYIEDFLTALGAPISAMAIMNAKVEKNMRNSINRKVNCDTANADKTVDAAQEQVLAIQKLKDNGHFTVLGEKLQETACLRLEHPALSLSELATLLNPPVSKSCLNHRLRKLISLSKEEHKS